MPYTDDPEHVLADEVRFLIGDTNASREELTDNQVQYLLSKESNNPRRAAARAAEALAGKYAGVADEKQVGPLRLTFELKAKRYSDLAKRLWSQVASTSVVPYAGGISLADKETRELDPDRVDPAFSRRMMEYPLGDTTVTDERVS